MAVILHVRVTAQASSNQIKIETQADGSVLYRVYVTTPPEDGKANEQVIKLLSKHFRVAKSKITIMRGHTHKYKTIQIDGVDDL